MIYEFLFFRYIVNTEKVTAETSDTVVFYIFQYDRKNQVVLTLPKRVGKGKLTYTCLGCVYNANIKAKKSSSRGSGPGHGRHQHIDEVAGGAFQEVACQAVIGVQITDNRLNRSAALTALAFFIALVTVIFFERWSGWDDPGITDSPVTSITDGGLCRLSPAVVDVCQDVRQRLAVMNSPLMASNANDGEV